MQDTARRGGASPAFGARLVARRVGLTGLGFGVLLAAGCGRSDTVLYVDTDGEGTSFSYTTTDEPTETTDTEPVCGDGIVEGFEECDDGNGFDGDECTTECLFNVCGDGFLFEFVEECDPGPGGIGPNSACVPGCLFNVCGDGWVWSGVEACDDGNPFDGDGCNTDCSLPSCGNGIVDPGEDCDDQNFDNNDACLNTCMAASCGDGFLFEGFEECDNGGLNSNSAACTLQCTDAVCGDGFEFEGVEECDDGNDIENDGCTTACEAGECGDGIVQQGEECDDQNADNTDDCTELCQAATCGDGFVWADNEDCDDQNANDDDACHNDCSATSVISVGMGGNHTCALLDHGKLICWGNGDDGRTGYASEDNLGDDELAGTLGFVDAGGTVASIETGISHSCALYAGGNVRCWGRPTNGQLGYGDLTTWGDDEPPSAAPVLDLGDTVSLLATEGGAFHTCAVLDSGDLVCWGRSGNGRLGYAVGNAEQDVGDNETPAEYVALNGPVDVGGTVTNVVMGFEHTCALLDDGSVRCWGRANQGQLGYGNGDDVGDDETPASVGPVPLGGTAIQLAGGWFHNCVILDTNEIKCWGKGNEGRLGYGTPAWVGLNNTPADVGVVDLGGGIPVKVDAGTGHTCALLDDATIRCWGWGARGQLGYGNVTNIGDNEAAGSGGPVEIGGNAIDIAVDGNHTCATLEDGQIICWGHGGQGRLGYGSEAFVGDDEFPATVGPLSLF